MKNLFVDIRSVIEVNNKKLAILTCSALVYPLQYLFNNQVYSLIFILIAIIIFIFFLNN